MKWLIDGLRSSDAKWKFIVSGVSFNLGYKKVIEAISGNEAVQKVNLPGFDASPKSILGTTVDTWAGFPEDQNAILKTIKDNNLKNIIFLSSDSHTSAMDDGTNSGIPEVMSGNLAQNNSRLAWIMANVRTLPLIGNLITSDLSAWNGGGQGLGNNNFNNAFGNIEVFGNDSVRCKIIDEQGTIISTMTICDGGKPCSPNTVNQKSTKNNLLSIYPNPAKDYINVSVDNFYITTDAQIIVTDILGRKIITEKIKSPNTKINITEIQNGFYYLVFTSSKGNLIKSFQK